MWSKITQFEHNSCTSWKTSRPHPRRICRLMVKSAEDPRQGQMEALKQAMSNPAVAEQMKQLEEQMANPQVQQEMQQMMSVMADPQFKSRMEQLREDPELKPMFEEIRTGGMAAMMKYMNDPTFLSKIGERLGDAIPGAASPAVDNAAPLAEITNILDAAKYGDVEAVEDFLAVGKGADRDAEGRCALHYAVGFDKEDATKALLDNGVDVNEADNRGNTAVHFAAGYGRGDAIRILINAGANVAAKNSEGFTAGAMIKAEPRNPLNNDVELMTLLGE